MFELWFLIVVAVLAVGAAWCYRAGGSGEYPFYFRELGLMITVSGALVALGFWHWTMLLTAGLTYGAQTTYFKRKGYDAELWNWTLVGLAFSLAVLPVIFVYGNWLGFIIRTVVCTGGTAMWSELVGNDVWEERGRGFIQVATLPLLLIGA